MPRQLRGWIILIALVAIGLGLLTGPVVRRLASPEQRAQWASAAGKHADAAAIYWDELQRGHVTVPIVVAFLEEHHVAKVIAVHADFAAPPGAGKAPKERPPQTIPQAAVDAFFTRPDLPREVQLVAQLQRGEPKPEVIAELHEAASKDPPMPWANHVLASEAHAHGRLLDAAVYYEREAVAFGRRDDLDTALRLRLSAGDRDGVIQRLDDPRTGSLAPAPLHFELAMERRMYGRALRWLLPFAYPKPKLGPLMLALVAAAAWGAFCLRLGQVRLEPARRVPLYAAAFALGALSIAPTMFLIVWQEQVLHLKPDGTPLRDAIFYVFGVGFREELSKVVCFLPLLPLLRRGKPIEVVTCAALVGLGFAAVENLQYFARDDLGSALGRFLTANFLHMSMTAIAATAAARIGKSEEGFHDFTVAFLTVVLLHGVYDFFIASPIVGDMSFLAMVVFVFLARDFVLAMHDARLRAGRSKPLLPVFAVGTACVTGAAFVYGSALVGPGAAAEMMFLGLLGVAVLAIVFVKQLRAL
ncbi:MAG: PrsW family intramembrane metalloprotease [Deltaproteobacteria bacterium]|nr:PrsW family intramembrane metalloprotease [Deltaproteobacteria bacterium]